MASKAALKRVLDSDDVARELMFTALAVYPDLADVSKFMAEQGYEASEAKLAVYRDGRVPGHDDFIERRKQLAPRIEAMLADDLLSAAQRTTSVVNLAVEQTHKLLAAGECKEPSKVARDLSQVAAQQIEKRLSLEGRPTQITEDRSLGEIVRALEGLGVVKKVDAESTAEDETMEDVQLVAGAGK
jgi:hypothetical protein